MHAYAALTALAEQLDTADIAAVAVEKRLANTLAKTNKKHRAAIDLDPEEPALAGRWPGMPSKISYKPSEVLLGWLSRLESALSRLESALSRR